MAPPPSTTIAITGTSSGFEASRCRSSEAERLYRKHQQAGVGFARRRGAEDPEGLFDQVFLDVMSATDHGANLNGDDGLAAYLYRALANRVVSEHRKRRCVTVTFEEGTHDGNHLGSHPAPEDQVVQSDWVQELLDHLTASEREVVVSRYFDGHSSAETATLMGKSPAAVRQLHRSAMVRLRYLLAVAVVLAVAFGAAAVVHATGSGPISTDPANNGDPSARADRLSPSTVSDAESQRSGMGYYEPRAAAGPGTAVANPTRSSVTEDLGAPTFPDSQWADAPAIRGGTEAEANPELHRHGAWTDQRDQDGSDPEIEMPGLEQPPTFNLDRAAGL